MSKKLLSILLAISIIFTMLPVGVMGEEENTSIDIIDEIIEFEELEEREKTVELGTSVDDLELPETLTATVRTTTTTTSSAIELEDSESDELEEVSDPQFEETTKIIPVTWISQPEYDMNTEGNYVFTPVVEGYIIIAELPQITVTVVEMQSIEDAHTLSDPLPETTYELWVGGVQVTDSNKDDVLGTIDGDDGTVTYDPTSNTLTLNGANITAVYEKTEDSRIYQYGIYAGITDLKMVLTGDSTIKCPEAPYKYSYGVYTAGKLEISGTGSLSANSGKGSVSYGIYSEGELTIKSGTITGSSVALYTSVGIYGDKVNISGGNVTATSTEGTTRGMIANSYNITGGKITATGEIGLSANLASNPINISGGEVNAIGTANHAITGILNFSGGTVIAKGATKALNGKLNLISGIATASTNYDGSSPVTYAPANIESYKYLMFMANASGAAITTAATAATVSHGEITVNAAVANPNPGGQAIEYAISANGSTAPGSGWQETTSFSGLSPSTTYYVWARTAAKAGYAAGAAVASAAITTTVAPANASISPTSVTFDLNPKVNGRDGFDVTLTSETYTLTAVKNGETSLSKINDYSVEESLYHFKYQYLKNLPIGLTTITFDMSGGTSPTLALTIVDTRTELTSVAIDNTAPTLGDTLSATINPSGAAVSYVWRADSLIVGTGATYEVKAADIGKIITLTVTGTGAYKGTITSTATSAVVAKDYTVTVDSTKSVAQGSGLSALPTASSGGVDGTLTWYTNSERTKVVTETGVRSLINGSVVTVYWSFTTTTAGYDTTARTGSCVVTIVSGSAQILSFAESTVTKTVGDLAFTNTLTHSVGTGAVTYSSSNESVAIVHPTSGAVVIVGAGTTTITANAAMVPGLYAPGSTTFTLTVNSTPTYTITANPTNKNFGSLTVGYSTPTGQTVTIRNTGNSSVTLTQPTSTNYTIGALSDTTLAANGTATFTVTPKTGLAVGDYDETLTVSTNHSTNATIELSFSVTSLPTPTYSVTYNANGGTGSMTNSIATDGISFTLPSNEFTAPSGKQFKAWTIGSISGTQVNAGGTYTFTGDTTVYAIWEDIPVTNHTVTVNGSYATTSGSGSYAAGTIVTIDSGSRSNYTFTGWTASGVTLANANSISTSFTMPANTVAVTANWRYNGGGSSGGDSGSGGGSSSNENSSPAIVRPPATDKDNGNNDTKPSFTDIVDHWAKDDIEFVVDKGLFSGTSSSSFSPDTDMTRGMFVTVLGRLANIDVNAYKNSSFMDVDEDSYYMSYIQWASENNISNGIGNNKYAPDQAISREQMAVFISNYAKTIGYVLPGIHEENTFTDSSKINDYAKDAVKQLQMAGLIDGKDGNLFDPQGTASRAEIATVLRRFVELVNSAATL